MQTTTSAATHQNVPQTTSGGGFPATYGLKVFRQSSQETQAFPIHVIFCVFYSAPNPTTAPPICSPSSGTTPPKCPWTDGKAHKLGNRTWMVQHSWGMWDSDGRRMKTWRKLNNDTLISFGKWSMQTRGIIAITSFLRWSLVVVVVVLDWVIVGSLPVI